MCAWYVTWLHYWEKRRAEGDRRVYLRLAFATRYGRIGFDEAARMSWRRLNGFNDAVAELLEGEKPKPT